MSIVTLVRELRGHTFKNGLCLRLIRQFASSGETKPDETLIQDNEVKLVEEEYSEDAIDEIRNKSKLNKTHYDRFHRKAPSISEDQKVVYPLRRLRRLYGEFGSASEINIGLLWPSKEEMALERERERVAYPDSVLQMIENAKKKKEEDERVILERQNDIAKKMLKLEDWKREVRENVAQQERSVREAKDKKERLIEEVRQMFGFRIDPKDEKFKEALEKKEKEEKKAVKAAKKLKKQQKIIADMQRLAQKTSTQIEEKTSAQIDEQSNNGADFQATEVTPTTQLPTEGNPIAQPPNKETKS